MAALEPDDRHATQWEHVLFEVKKVIVGQEHLLEIMLVALLAKGHILIEGVPGLAKTLAIKTMANTINGKFQRIQFTPDLVPSDLVGTRIYNQQNGEFGTQFGPVFTNLLLADEINRAPAKVQSALLEVMQEHQVTIGSDTYPVPEPFLVLATQNPIESEGTYSLPEAQIDRFMFKTVIGYPDPREESAIVSRVTGAMPPAASPVMTTDQLLAAQKQVDTVYVDPKIIDYAVMLATATRKPADFGLPQLNRFISYGASPRGSINLVLGAKALATLRGRDYVVPDDIRDLALDVLRHRIVLSYEALAQDVTGDNIVKAVLSAVRPPKLELTDRSPAPALP